MERRGAWRRPCAGARSKACSQAHAKGEQHGGCAYAEPLNARSAARRGSSEQVIIVGARQWIEGSRRRCRRRMLRLSSLLYSAADSSLAGTGKAGTYIEAGIGRLSSFRPSPAASRLFRTSPMPASPCRHAKHRHAACRWRASRTACGGSHARWTAPGGTPAMFSGSVAPVDIAFRRNRAAVFTNKCRQPAFIDAFRDRLPKAAARK